MLKSLIIKNYALIDHLEMKPSPLLNIITGETGAGKSIMLGAVGLLLGNRADTQVLSDRSKKCFIEGEFSVEEYDLEGFFEEKDLDYEKTVFIRREIGISGKSRAFVNDTPVTLDTLKELGTFLMDVHSQNDTQLLGSLPYQLALIDAFSNTKEIFLHFKVCYNAYRVALSHFEKIQEEEGTIRKEADFNNHLLEELNKANFFEGEQKQIEEELDVLENSEDIKTHFNQALGALSGSEYAALTGIHTSLQELKQLVKYSESYQELYNRLESMLIEANDISNEISKLEEIVDYDPHKITDLKDRLGLLYHLQQKHQVNTITELLSVQSDLAEKVSRYHNLDSELALAKNKMDQTRNNASEVAKKLSKTRQSSFRPFCDRIIGMMTELGMKDARVEIIHQESELSASGIDYIEIHFSANKGVTPKPLKAVASGGEFSRLMFGVKYLMASKTSLPTIIFDEIDSGVSGEIALKLGAMMREMAQNHQVISISHLPQIAAKAERHFYVFKDDLNAKSVSKIRELSGEERVEEIAKMIGGDQPTDSARTSARELMLN